MPESNVRIHGVEFLRSCLGDMHLGRHTHSSLGKKGIKVNPGLQVKRIF